MRIRKYNGKDMQEALAKVRADLGVEAVILNSRKVKRKGVAAWFSKPYFEVLAAVDENFIPSPPRGGPGATDRKMDAWREPGANRARNARAEAAPVPAASVAGEARMPTRVSAGALQDEPAGVVPEKPAAARYGAAAYAAARDAVVRELPVSDGTARLFGHATGQLDERDGRADTGPGKPDELSQLKEQVESMARMLERLQTASSAAGNEPLKPAGTTGRPPVSTPAASATSTPAVAPASAPAVKTTVASGTAAKAGAIPDGASAAGMPASRHPEAEGTDPFSAVLLPMRQRLQLQEIDTPLADRILSKVRTLVPANASMDDIRRQTERVLLAALGEPEPIRLRQDGQPCVAAFIGPTGVGKTTTLAKIAAEFSLVKGKKVGLITADTYRIAAVEQLKTYAEILNLPVTVVYAPSDMPAAIRAHQDKDLILIDTAGRSHRNRQQFDELRQLLAATPLDEVFLVMSVNTGRAACLEVLDHYSFVREYKLLFTKLDETPVSGVIFNARLKTGKKLSYVTAGQSVPDDLAIADPRSLAAIAVDLDAG